MQSQNQLDENALGCQQVPKELGPAYVRTMREALATAVERQRRKRLPGQLLLPGLCLPKALSPLLPIYLQGVLQVRLALHVPNICCRARCQEVLQCLCCCSRIRRRQQCKRKVSVR